jgi:serine/threonine protein kinase
VGRARASVRPAGPSFLDGEGWTGKGGRLTLAGEQPLLDHTAARMSNVEGPKVRKQGPLRLARLDTADWGVRFDGTALVSFSLAPIEDPFVAIVCPHCQHSMSVKGAKPGRYTPKCSRCKQPFLIVVPEDPARPVTAAPLPKKAADKTAAVAPPAPGLEETTAPTEGPPDAAAGHFSVAPEVVPREEQPGSSPSAPPLEATVDSGPGDGPAEEPDADKVPATLGGYQIIKELGRGGMGAVYLARQISLDRNVALKVMKAQWASQPSFVARFTREAYAAAQLVHHNVVQIYDLGIEQDVHYFSMEFVDGDSLADVVKRAGKLDPEVAAGYILQAARGLKFAHDRGMIHRDVKPANLMLNTQGVVKVADLGLVKTPGSTEAPAAAEPEPDNPPKAKAGRTLADVGDITQANRALGTPMYMAPEQTRDAARVDHRADIYSLGCTFYALVTGRAPFTGSSALEIMSKHAREAVVPPEAIARQVPKAVSATILKMVAKDPADRYPDMAAVIKALEDFLGVQGAGPFSPSEEHAQALEESVRRFRQAPAGRLRSLTLLGFVAGWAVLVLLCLLLRWWSPAGGLFGLGLLTAVCHFIIAGVTRKTHLFLKVREYLLGCRLTDWLLTAAGLLLVLVVLWLAGLLWLWLFFGALAVALAVAFHFLIDRRLEQERRAPLETVERLLRGLRLRGLEEESLRHFVCKYSGEHWEEFYEALFGYEAKLKARARWAQGDRGRPRARFATWREPICRWIDAREQARQEAREKKTLQAVEEKNLQAQGLDAAQARARAERAAQAMVQNAAALKEEAAPEPAPAVRPQPVTVAEQPAGTTPDVFAAEEESEAQARFREERLRRSVQALLDASDREEAGPIKPRPGVISRTLGALLGPQMRFLLGALLLTCCLLWLYQKHLIGQDPDTHEWRALAEKFLEQGEPYELPLLLVKVPVLSNINPGVAGLLLIVSALFGGWRLGLFLIPAAALMTAGHLLPWPEGLPLAPNLLSLAAGGVLTVVGFLFGRTAEA